jgi:hypothetical protein
MPRKRPFSYQWQPSVLLRATTAPDGIGDLLTALGAFHDPEQGRDWLAELWRNEQVRDALEAASPVLVSRVLGLRPRRWCTSLTWSEGVAS